MTAGWVPIVAHLIIRATFDMLNVQNVWRVDHKFIKITKF